MKLKEITVLNLTKNDLMFYFKIKKISYVVKVMIMKMETFNKLENFVSKDALCVKHAFRITSITVYANFAKLKNSLIVKYVILIKQLFYHSTKADILNLCFAWNVFIKYFKTVALMMSQKLMEKF